MRKNLDEGPPAPILTLQRGPMRLYRSAPLWARRLAWRIRRHPEAARLARAFLILPDGRSNVLPGNGGRRL
jgi:hypothetical protein